MRTVRRVSALLLAGGLLAIPGSAMAHDELTGSEPTDGSAGEAPDDLTLSFSGQIAEVGAAVTVTDPDGSSVTEGEPEVDGSEVEQDLVDDLADGQYAVVWRVTSEDGHPISGEFSFTAEGSGSDETTDDEPTEAEDAESSPAESSEEAPAETAEEQTSDEPAPAETENADDPASDEESEQPSEATSSVASGVPGWAWAFVAVAAAGLLGMLAWTWQRGRS
ncbi:copper resistance CopC family protein [Serinicoccus kebangsaanensis]|uniref:copper resistance CopC family protein n=1 Tax=Serinicoccus kebangsaanensis TaxID=2602069 RepID=UPI00124E4526|nr:copper resistance CopC family protein [Serinicoccus kebangsaanensis]